MASATWSPTKKEVVLSFELWEDFVSARQLTGEDGKVYMNITMTEKQFDKFTDEILIRKKDVE